MEAVRWVNNVYWIAYWDIQGVGVLAGYGYTIAPDVPEARFRDVDSMIQRMTEISPRWYGLGVDDDVFTCAGDVAFYHAVLPLLENKPVLMNGRRSKDSKATDRKPRQIRLF